MEQILIESPVELRKWLSENHASAESVWLVKWKKESGQPFISYDEIVDELICFGWVDSLPKKLNDQKTMLRISPRNPKSNWSRVNKDRVDRMEQENRMQEAGRQLVAIAKENGGWTFLDDVEQLIVPEDLAAALKKVENADYHYQRFPDSSKRGILEWIKTAKQPATREKRIMDTAEKAGRNLKANHPKGRDAGPKSDRL